MSKELDRAHRLLEWNRSQPEPPIAIGREYEVAAALAMFAALASPAGEDGETATPCCPPEDLSDYIHVTVLRDQLSRHAEPTCRECDGQGLYMGNVCVCNCITDTLASRAPTAEGTREGFAGFIRSSGAEKDAAMLEVADAAIAKQSRTREGGEGEGNG